MRALPCRCSRALRRSHRPMRRMIELDGLRGLACLSVLVAHYFGEVAHGWNFLALGWAGVDLFFCLSGFLIGGILLDNRSSPSYFSSFYIRRGAAGRGLLPLLAEPAVCRVRRPVDGVATADLDALCRRAVLPVAAADP